MDDELTRLFRAITTGFHSRLEQLPAHELLQLPLFQARLFGAIGRNPGVTQQALAKGTARDKAQVARAIAELERRGFVSKAAHESDWRAHGLFLTEEGGRIWAIAEHQRRDLVADTFKGLSQQEKGALRDILEKIVVRLESGGDTGS
ncbi:MarR family winged helix-turn-helix transcriptional regulator [Sphingomonas sp. 3P27F8]|uniref:MarR family winged helix-turn-helix transcriptional regulator n=1 Tax=Sphingomonas sp. 3P27F8 TaxID=2502213 RepID=UPI0010F7EB24|nr:MarR family winged helix-turn-helix transcriptional regulator [Sphingomonas sp. 3P27F8]